MRHLFPNLILVALFATSLGWAKEKNTNFVTFHPVKREMPAGGVKLAISDFHVCVVASDELRCVNGLYASEEAFNPLPDVRLAFVKDIQIAKFSDESLAGCVLDQAGVHCWGIYSNVPKDLGVPSQIVVGLSRVCALTEGNVRCWGEPIRRSYSVDVKRYIEFFTDPSYVNVLHKNLIPLSQLKGIHSLSLNSTKSTICGSTPTVTYCWPGFYDSEKTRFAVPLPPMVLDSEKAISLQNVTVDDDIWEVWRWKCNANDNELVSIYAQTNEADYEFKMPAGNCRPYWWSSPKVEAKNVTRTEFKKGLDLLADSEGYGHCWVGGGEVDCGKRSAELVPYLNQSKDITDFAMSSYYLCVVGSDGLVCRGRFRKEFESIPKDLNQLVGSALQLRVTRLEFHLPKVSTSLYQDRATVVKKQAAALSDEIARFGEKKFGDADHLRVFAALAMRPLLEHVNSAVMEQAVMPGFLAELASQQATLGVSALADFGHNAAFVRMALRFLAADLGQLRQHVTSENERIAMDEALGQVGAAVAGANGSVSSTLRTIMPTLTELSALPRSQGFALQALTLIEYLNGGRI